jgi:hypothetical protein
MKTLEDMKAQLDRVEEMQATSAESQGRLLAAIDALKAEFSGDFAKLYNGHGLCLEKLGLLIDAWNLMARRARPRKRANRPKGKGAKRA